MTKALPSVRLFTCAAGEGEHHNVLILTWKGGKHVSDDLLTTLATDRIEVINSDWALVLLDLSPIKQPSAAFTGALLRFNKELIDQSKSGKLAIYTPADSALDELLNTTQLKGKVLSVHTSLDLALTALSNS